MTNPETNHDEKRDRVAKIIAFSNHKGGVGKTSISVSVADAMARDGLEVLLLDLDPQANATNLLYGYDAYPPITLEKVLDGTHTIAEAIIEDTRVPGVHLVGCSLKLSNLEKVLQVQNYASYALVHDALKPVIGMYDVILIDTPPALSYFNANAMTAADYVFVPIESGSRLSLTGSDDMLNFISQARRQNPRLELGGAILTKHDGRKKVCQLMAVQIGLFYERMCAATIPDLTTMKAAQAVGQTPLQAGRDSPMARAIVALAREIEEICKLERSEALNDDQ